MCSSFCYRTRTPYFWLWMIKYQTSNIVQPITTDFKNLTERLAHFVQLLHRTVLLVKKFEKAAFAFFGSVLERIIWDLLGSNSDIKRETASSFEKEIDLKQSNFFFFSPLQFFRLLPFLSIVVEENCKVSIQYQINWSLHCVSQWIELHLTMLQILSKCEVKAALCENFTIYLSFKFYMKSNSSKFKR